MTNEPFRVKPLKRGYFLPQDFTAAGPEGQWIVDFWPEWYCNRPDFAREQLGEWRRRKLDGIEFIPLVFQQADVGPVLDLAKMVRDHGIDVWLTPRLFKTFGLFPIVPDRYAARQLTKEGRIVTALKNMSVRPDLDFFNAEAVEWAFGIFKEQFLDPLPNGFQGYIWPEEFHGTSLHGRIVERGLIPWWQRPAYSDHCLELWRQYCRKHHVVHDDKIVDKLPVSDRAMVANGRGKTEYYPGLAAVPEIVTDMPMTTWPRNTGVWAHWDAFRCEAYLNNYLRLWSRRMHEANANNPDWRGVEYFGSSPWLVAYEDFTDPQARNLEAWGRQCGIDLAALGRTPEITCICHEFRGRVTEAQLERRHDLFLSLLDGRARANHGVLLHGDTDFKDTHPDDMLEETEEVERWRFIAKYRPRLISMWNVNMLHPMMSYYRKDRAERFWRRLRAYQTTGDPFADEPAAGRAR